jgi:hypothetical protein
MNFQEQIDIHCIGHLNSQEILKNCGFWYTYCQHRGVYIPEFMDKIILDFWCGVSDLLTTIQNVSEPQKLYGVDPIFENEDTLIQAQEELRQHLEKYSDMARWFIRRSIFCNNTIGVQSRLRERFRSSQEFRVSGSGIEYNSSIESIDLWEVDIIFVSFLMYRVKQHNILLDMLLLYLNSHWSIYITDFPLDRFPVIQEYSPELVSGSGSEYKTLKIKKPQN